MDISRSPPVRRIRSPSPNFNIPSYNWKVCIKELITGMNSQVIETLVISALDFTGTNSPVKSVTINEKDNSALVTFDSEESSRKCLDAKELTYFGKVIPIVAASEFILPMEREESLRCEFKFPNLGVFLGALEKNRTQLEEILHQGISVKFPQLIIELEGKSRSKVEEACGSVTSMLDAETFTTF